MLSNSEVAVFCEQSGMILESGLSMLEGISILEADVGTQNIEYKKMYEEMRSCLEETGIFYEALIKTGMFPDYVIHMTKIGEETGNLDVVMKGLAAYYEREENTMQDIKNAISYPLMILCMLLVIMLVMIVKVMPVFEQVYEQLGSGLTGFAAILLKVGELLKHYWVVPALAVCLLAGMSVWLLKTAQGNVVLRKLTGRFFSKKSIVKRLNSARVSSAFSMTLQSGMDYERSFDMAASLLEDDEATREKLLACKEKMLEGESFSKVIKETNIYSPLQSRMIMIAERTGEADQALSKIAVQIDDEVTAEIQNFVSVIEPTLVIVLSVLVGGMLLSVMLPLLGILSVIS